MKANNYDCDQFCEVLPIERNRMRGLQSLRYQLLSNQSQAIKLCESLREPFCESMASDQNPCYIL